MHYEIKKHLKRIKQFISDYFLYTKWKDNDRYPSLIYNNLYFQRFCELTGFSYFRVLFWNLIARNYSPFRGFYNNGINTTANKNLNSLFKDGYLLQNNFLSEDIHSKYGSIFQEGVDKFLNSIEFSNSEVDQMRVAIDLSPHDLSEFESEVSKLLNKYTLEIYQKKIKPSFRYELEVSKNGTDSLSALSKWHIDRPCPSLKALYFPLGVNIAPFSYIKGSHLYNERWKSRSSFFRDSKNYQQISKKNVMLKDDTFFSLNEDLNKNIVELNNLEPNTFYLGAHQGLHRKKPFDKNGYRFMISIEFTHYFSKYDLLLGSFRSRMINAFNKFKL